MKKTLLFSLLCVILVCSRAFAQKDAPIAGNAATLIDLLKKNYSASNPETRDDEIITDRTLVLNIFKSYLTDEEQRSFTDSIKSDPNISSKTAKDYRTYLNFKKTNSLLSTATISSSTKNPVKDLTTNATNLGNSQDTAYETYLDDKFNADTSQLGYIRDIYKPDNRFIGDMLETFIEKYKELKDNGVDAMGMANHNSSVQKSIPFFGGDLAFQTVIDGLSKFLVKRIKEELTTYIVDKVKIWLQNPTKEDPFAEFKVIMPSTTHYLLSFTADKAGNFPKEIRQYIEDDLNHIIDNAPNLESTPRIQELIQKYPDIDFAFEALQLIPSISKLKYPIDYFTILENSRNLNRWASDTNQFKHNLANLIEFSSMLAHSMTIIDNDEPRFAGSDFLENYASDLNFYELYFGFLYQQNSKYYNIGILVKKGNEIKLNKAFNQIVNLPITTAIRDTMLPIFNKVGKEAENVYNTALDLRMTNKAGKKIGADTVHTFVKSIIDLASDMTSESDHLINYLLTISLASNDPPIPRLDLTKKAHPYFLAAGTVNDVVLNIQKKEYATGLINILELAGSLVPESTISNISSNISLLTNFQSNNNLKTWSLIIDSIKSGKTLTVKKDLQNSAYVLAGELNNISLFYLEKNKLTVSDTLYKRINSLKLLTLDIYQTGRINGSYAQIGDIQAMLIDPKFKLLVISYYTNLQIDKLIDSLKTEMRTIQIGGVNAFSTDEIDKMGVLIQNYAIDIYSNYVENGAKNSNDKLIKDGKNLEMAIGSYLLSVPKQFTGVIDPTILALIHFVSDMAVANNSDDVEKAIEDFALPSGSYSIKRTSIFNAAINSFPGLLPAYELTWKNGRTYGATSFGITAPVGISIAWGTEKGSSNGLFVSIIDIGAVTRLRFDNSDSTKALPQFTLSNILAPGLYFHHGFPKSPLSINVGAQYGPDLQVINPDGTAKYYESVRFGVGLVLDIPLFNLYTKPRN